MAKPNEITFTIEDYDGNATEMFADIGKVLKILTKLGYICTFRCDDQSFQIYQIEFDYEDGELDFNYCPNCGAEMEANDDRNG